MNLLTMLATLKFPNQVVLAIFVDFVLQGLTSSLRRGVHANSHDLYHGSSCATRLEPLLCSLRGYVGWLGRTGTNNDSLFALSQYQKKMAKYQ